MTGLFRTIADTIAPPDLTCAVCGGERDVLRGFGVCRACAKTLRPLNETVCVAPNVEAISAFVYEENAAKLVHDLKYGAKGHAAYVLGAFMAARCEDLKRSDFVVVPVSMHPRRYLSRGFNQSVYLAREVSSRLSLPVCSALCKTRNTPHQTGLDAKSRNENLTDSWRVKDRAAVQIHGQFAPALDQAAMRHIAACGDVSRKVDDVADANIFKILRGDGRFQYLFGHYSFASLWDVIV